MSPFRSTMLVAERELRETMRRKTFWIVLAVLFLGSTAAVVLPEVLDDDDPTTYHVAVSGDATGFGPALQALGPAVDGEIEIVPVTDLDAARQQVSVVVGAVRVDRKTIGGRVGHAGPCGRNVRSGSIAPLARPANRTY